MALQLADLVRNGTMSAAIAATLSAAVEARRSFLVFAVPRLAGKSTVKQAMLAHVPAGTPIHNVTGTPREAALLRGGGGYLVIEEISRYPFEPTYIWGTPVRRVLSLLERGYSLAAALHAPSVDEAFAILCGQNGVPDDHAARITLAVYIRSIGDWRAPVARRVAAVHEIDGVSGGRPRARPLHLWDEAADRFVDVNEPRAVSPR